MRFLRSVIWWAVLLSPVLLLSAENCPLPLGAADLATARDTNLSSAPSILGSSISLEQAFQVEALEQLDLQYEQYEPDAPSELERLKQENARLQLRVAELERRLTAVEAKLK